MENLKIFLKELQERKLIANLADHENIYQLNPNRKVIYWGIDCTAESLHIGHLFLCIQAIRFAKEGFEILLVLGGATSKIGDPSDKDKERPLLTEKDIENYQEKIKFQLEKIFIKPKEIKKFDFSPLEKFYSDDLNLLVEIYKILGLKKNDKIEKQWTDFLQYIWPLKGNKFRLLNNNEWLNKISFIDFINEVGRKIRVNNLIKKEFVKKRINSKTGLSFLEFSYSLLQAYDFCYLYENYNCCGQLGGSDQWGNLTIGLELIKNTQKKKGEVSKAFAFVFNLLTDQAGKKISKSEKNEHALQLNDKKKTFYDFFQNLSDKLVEIYLEQFTFLSKRQISELLNLNIRNTKLRIGQRILLELVFWLNYGEISPKL